MLRFLDTFVACLAQREQFERNENKVQHLACLINLNTMLVNILRIFAKGKAGNEQNIEMRNLGEERKRNREKRKTKNEENSN